MTTITFLKRITNYIVTIEEGGQSTTSYVSEEKFREITGGLGNGLEKGVIYLYNQLLFLL